MSIQILVGNEWQDVSVYSFVVVKDTMTIVTQHGKKLVIDNYRNKVRDTEDRHEVLPNRD